MVECRPVRIKRRRSEDPLPALVVRGAKRKRTDGISDSMDAGRPLIFTLASSPELVDPNGKQRQILKSDFLDLKISDELGKKTERVYKVSRERDLSSNAEELPAELHDMIRDYIQASNEPCHQNDTIPKAGLDPETEDYVYDVYYCSRPESAELPLGAGYIDLEKGEEQLFFGIAEKEDDSEGLITDDEDSNAEDFYRNDYPEGASSASDLDSDIAGLEEGLGDLHIEEYCWSEDDS